MFTRVDYSTYLRVEAPRQPQSRGGSREATIDKLARHVAVVFGVDIPDNPVGVTWVANFNDITLTELSRGALLPPRTSAVNKAPLPDGFWFADRGVVKGVKGGSASAVDQIGAQAVNCIEIPAATLHQFGPDTKAATILSGSNRLFRPFGPVISQVLTTIGYLADGTQVADETRIAAWASLVLEIYRQQPALFVASLQARSVQRASQIGWQPWIGPGDSKADVWATARAEYTKADPATYREQHSETHPTRLDVLDTSLRQGFAHPPLLVKSSAADDPAVASNDFLLDELCANLTRYLTQSVDGGLAWVVDSGDGHRWVDVYLPQTAILEALVGSQLSSDNLTVEPYGGGEAVIFDSTIDEHIQRILPRVPAVPEMRPLSPRVQASIITTLMTLHTFFIGRPNLPPQAEEIILEDRRKVVTLAERTFGPDSILALIARVRWAGSRSRRRPNDADAAAARTTCMRELAERYSRGEIGVGVWTDIVVNVSPSLNSSSRRQWESGNHAEARRQRAELLMFWESALSGLGIDRHQMLDEDGEPKRSLFNVTSLLQNYIGVSINDPDNPERAIEHIELGLHVLLKVRKRVSDDRQNTGPYRKTLQILIRAAGRQLEGQLDVPQRERLLRVCADLTRDLMSLSEWDRFISSGVLIGAADISTAMSMLRGIVALAENDRPYDKSAIASLCGWLVAAMNLDAAEPATHPTFTAQEVRDLVDRAQLAAAA